MVNNAIPSFLAVLLAEQAQAAIERPSEAHNLPGPALVAALQGQLAQIDSEPTASRHPAAALVVALVARYRLPIDIALPVQIDTRLDSTSERTAA